LASYTLAFALQPRKKHGKTSVRVAASKNYPCEECPRVSWKGRCICAQTPWTYWAFGSSVRSCQ